MKRERDPWAPLGFAVTAASGFVVLLLLGSLAGLVTTIATGNAGSWGVFGYGSDDVCVTARPGVLPYGEAAPPNAGFQGMKTGISQSASTVQVCDLHASSGQHALYAVDQLVGLLFFLGFLFSAVMLIRAGRVHGSFTTQVAQWLTRIGGYVVAGSLVVGLIQAVLRSRLLGSMTIGGEGAAVLMMFGVSVPVLIAGFGALTAGRVMARSVALQREVDTLV